MAGGLPKLGVIHVGRDDFLEATLAVLATKKIYQRIVDMGPVWSEEAGSWAKFVEEEQLMFPSQLSMVPFGGFFLQFLPFLQLLGVRKRNALITEKENLEANR